MSEIISAIAGGVAVIIGTAVAVVRRSRKPKTLPPPREDREVTGSYRLGDLGSQADIAFIREIVVQLREGQAESAGDRAREYINRETVARMAELLDQHYVASERSHGEMRRAVQRLDRRFDDVTRLLNAALEELRNKYGE